jgi:hypothetical protein
MSILIPRVRTATSVSATEKKATVVKKPANQSPSTTMLSLTVAPATPPVLSMTKIPPVNTRLASFVSEDYFGKQPTSSAQLPDPTTLVENLARSVLEILAGARELDQIARWVTDDVYNHLVKRVHISQRARTLKNVPALRPSFTVGRTLISQPADGVVEAVVVLHGKARSRSVAIRLEGMDNRWRASAVHVL